MFEVDAGGCLIHILPASAAGADEFFYQIRLLDSKSSHLLPQSGLFGGVDAEHKLILTQVRIKMGVAPIFVDQYDKINILMFSKRTNWDVKLNHLSQTIGELRKKGEKLIDLTESNPTRCGFRYLSPEILAPLANPRNLLYDPSPKGMLHAREAIAAYYANKEVCVSPEQIFLTASTSEAYTFLFRLLCDPQDHFLIPRPSYPLLEFLADLNDVTLDAYRLVYDQCWQMDLKGLQSKMGPKTRGIVVVHPNNPTGSYVKENELSFLNRVCLENSLALISDEVFFDFNLDDRVGAGFKPAPTLAENNNILSFTLSGLSKVVGLPQMKLGWIIVSGPPSLTKQAISRMEVIADTYLSVSTPAQNALANWIQRAPLIQKEILERVKVNRRFLLEQCNVGAGLNPAPTVLHSEGGWYSVLRVEGIDEEKFVLNLLEKEGVVVHPGYFFDFESEQSYLVLSLLPSPDIFKEGINRLLSSRGGFETRSYPNT